MTESVRIVFEYQCQRCGFAWSSTAFVRTDETVVFIVCGTCRALVRPHYRVKQFRIWKTRFFTLYQYTILYRVHRLCIFVTFAGHILFSFVLQIL